MEYFPGASGQNELVERLPRRCVHTLEGHTSSILVVRVNPAGAGMKQWVICCCLILICMGSLLTWELHSNEQYVQGHTACLEAGTAQSASGTPIEAL